MYIIDVNYIFNFIKKYFKYLPHIFLFAVSIWSIYPIIINPTHSYFKAGDDALITWQINQTIQKIPDNLWNIFETNIFYPYKHTLAFTNLAVPSALIGYFPVKLTGSPFAAYNTLIIVTQILSAVLLFILFNKISKDPWASLVGTLSLIISNFHMQSIAHIHVFMMHWWLISVLLLISYKDSKKIKYLYFAFLFLVIQIWESYYQAFWIVLFAFIILIPEVKFLKKEIKHIFLISLFMILFTSPIIFVYLKHVSEFGNLASIRTASHFSMSFDDIWINNFSFGIYINFLLALIILRKNIFNNKKTKLPIILFITGLFLALGPVLKWSDKTLKIFSKYFIPLPYIVLFYLLPGFSVLRSVDRFIGLSFFATAMIITIAVSSVKKGKNKFLVLFFLIIAIVGGKQTQKTYDFPNTENYPKVYSWLEKQPGKVILEYPIYLWTDNNLSIEMYRMVYSLKHKKYLINGASGFMPPDRESLLSDIKINYPNAKLHHKLIDLGVNYVIVHKNETENKAFDSDTKLKIIYKDNESSVYSYY